MFSVLRVASVPYAPSFKCLYRHVSTLSAIRRGIGRSQAAPHDAERNRTTSRPTQVQAAPRQAFSQPRRGKRRMDANMSKQSRSIDKISHPNDLPQSPASHFTQQSARTPRSRPASVTAASQGGRRNTDRARTSNHPAHRNEASDSRDSREPKAFSSFLSVPYTTSASEFLYGRSVVEAALKAGRRQLYKLYFDNTSKIPTSQLPIEEPLIKLAHAKGVDVRSIRREDAGRLLDRMSGGRPHNGVVLEASPLPRLSCTHLGKVEPKAGIFTAHASFRPHQDDSQIPSYSRINYGASGAHNPFVLLLDGILDPGNLGAILRSAFFLGVDAVVLSTHGSPISATALKASAGAAEILPLVTVRDTGNFVRLSQANGWMFYAAMPSGNSELSSKPTYSLRSLGHPLSQEPCMVMLGGEGTGLWKDLQFKADRFITIRGPRQGQAGVDSLNVSVSAALLIEAFIRGDTAKFESQRLWEAR